MSGNLDIKGTLQIDSTQATRGMNAVARAMEAFSKRANVSGAESIRFAKQMDAITRSARNLQKPLEAAAAAQAKLNTEMKRSALIQTKNDEVTARIGNSRRVNKGQTALLGARTDTEAIKQQIMQEEARSKIASRGLRDQLALRKQNFAEQTRMNRASEEQIGHFNQARYAIYDVTQSIGIAGAAMAGAAVASAGVAIEWQRDFANVARTTVNLQGDVARQTEGLKQQFVGLVQTIPTSWSELAEIGTLAGQIGIAKENVASFTQTVAMFAATSDVSVDQAATSFGRLSALTIDGAGKYREMADAVLKVGVNSTATESQILRVATQISSLTGAAGMGYEATIGLAGALASIAVPPELSRGVITRVFGTIEKAITKGGDKLVAFGEITGQSGEQFKQAWSEDSTGTFIRFMDGIREKGGGARQAIEKLGITSVRDVPVLLRLANAANSAGEAGGLLAQTMADAANASGTLQSQYAVISDTVSAKLTIFVNNFLAFVDAMGSSQLGAVGDILDGITKSLRNLTNSLDENATLAGFELPFSNAEAIAAGVAIVGIVGALGLLVAALGQVAGGVLAMRTLQASLPSISAAFSRTAGSVAAVNLAGKNMNSTFVGTPGIMERAKGGMRTAGSAAAGLLRTLGPLAVAIGVLATVDWGLNASKYTNDIDDYAAALVRGEDAMKTFLSATRVDTGWESMGQGTEKLFNSIREFEDAMDSIPQQDNFWANFGANVSTSWTAEYARATEAINLFDDAYQQMIDAGNQDAAFTSLQEITKGWNDNDVMKFLDRADDVKANIESILKLNDIKPTDAAIIDYVRDGIGSVGDAAVQSEEEVNELQQAYEKVIETIQVGYSSFIDFGTAIKDATDTESGAFDFSNFLTGIDAQLAAQTEWANNMNVLAGRVSQGLLKELGRLGPEGAPLVAALTTASAEELEKVEAVFAQSGVDAGTEFASNLYATQAALEMVADKIGGAAGKKAAAAAALELASGEKTLDQVLAQYDLDFEVDADTKPAKGNLDVFRKTESGKGFKIPVSTSVVQSSLNTVYNTIMSTFGRTITVPIRTSGGGNSGAMVPKARGGKVTGPGTSTSDSIHAMLSDDEFVIRAAAARSIGYNKLSQMNRTGAVPSGFAGGGRASANSSSTSSAGMRMSASSGITTAQIDPALQQVLQALSNRPIYVYSNDRLIAQSAQAGFEGQTFLGSN